MSFPGLNKAVCRMIFPLFSGNGILFDGPLHRFTRYGLLAEILTGTET